jgi:hypothetical protein
MSEKIALPAHLQNNQDAAARALADAASMASSSNSVPRVSLRGREFRFIEGGEEVLKKRDDIEVIILGVEPEAGRMIKTFYKDGYKQGAKEPPTCSSDDGISPSPWVTTKQADLCAKCPKNSFGSAISPNGKQTKACRDSKRIWIVRLDDPKPIADRVQYGLNVTVASLKAFSEYGRTLTSYGQAPCVAITKIKMVDSEFPQVEFELAGWADAETAPQTLRIASERPWKINYANAGLALGMNENVGRPSTLPGLPDHLKPQPPVQDATVVTPTQSPKVSAGQIDDAVGKW